MNDDDLRLALDDLLHDLPGEQPLPAATAGRVARRRGLKVGACALGGTGVLALATALVLGAGSTQDRVVVPGGTPSATAAPSPSASAAPSTAAGPSPSGAPVVGPDGPGTASGAPAADVRVVLRPDGLGVTDGGSATSSLPFGTDAATVRAAVERALQAGTQSPTPDCGTGSSTVQHDGLFLLLQDGAFVGWVSGTPGLTTGDGLGVGSTLAELRAALPGVQVSEGTLGAEWSTVEGGLAGFLEGTQDSSLVSSIAAGARCLAR